MSVSVGILQSSLRITHRTTNPDANSIYPRINVNFEVTHTAAPGAGAGAYTLALSKYGQHCL